MFYLQILSGEIRNVATYRCKKLLRHSIHPHILDNLHFCSHGQPERILRLIRLNEKKELDRLIIIQEYVKKFLIRTKRNKIVYNGLIEVSIQLTAIRYCEVADISIRVVYTRSSIAH